MNLNHQIRDPDSDWAQISQTAIRFHQWKHDLVMRISLPCCKLETFSGCERFPFGLKPDNLVFGGNCRASREFFFALSYNGSEKRFDKSFIV
jgi:hypothetical protein